MTPAAPGSSVNFHPTFEYVQPDEYHFSHDSVFLARFAFERTRDSVDAGTRVLDLCAGCGIVGLDYLAHLKIERGIQVDRADFVEVQPEYRMPFEENVRRLAAPRTRFTWLAQNYRDHHGGADVILCNPPYFHVGEGRLPAAEFRARCHFFRDAGWTELVECVKRSLRPGGRAFVLCRDPLRAPFAGARVVARIRGTSVWFYRRDQE